MSGKGKVYVGTSGWHYMHWKGPFYPAKAPARRFLDHYAEHFNATEINNTFYRLPKPETFMEWRDRTPSGFRFAVKASRYITHMKKLKDVGEGLAKFFDGIAVLEDRLGPILFQLPPNLKPDLERLEGFLDALPDKGLYVFEFRDPAWLSEGVNELLDKAGAAVCATEPTGLDGLPARAKLAYARLHGPHGDYTGRYSEDALEEWAQRLRACRDAGRDVYCFFDNDQDGAAPLDALALQAKLAAADAD